MSEQVATDKSMTKSMVKKGYCDHCEDACVTCAGMATCNHCAKNSSAFNKVDLHFTYSIHLAQTITEFLTQYHSQITIPDIRPPIV